jgi:hypothetical protein
LWWLDWHTLWRSTDAAGRDAARRAAAAAGLARYLRWAERRADALGRALDGDDAALDALGYGARRPRRDVHPFARHVVLAPSAAAAVASLREWTRPSWAGERDGGLVLGTLRRLARHWRLLLPSEAPARALGMGASRTHDATEVIAAARTVVSAGGEMWLRVTGRSMTPTLGEGDSVLLSGPGGRVRPGDVVLAAAPRGPLLHRVRRVSGATVVTQGDACDTADGELESDAVVARAVAVRRGQVVAALTPTLRFGVGPLLRYCVRALRRSRRPAARLWRA